MQKEASAKIKINKLLEESGWQFEDFGYGKSNISLEPGVDILDIGDDFKNVSKGYIDYLLLDKDSRPQLYLKQRKSL